MLAVKTANILQMTPSDAFSCMKIIVFGFEFHEIGSQSVHTNPIISWLTGGLRQQTSLGLTWNMKYT